MVTDFEALYKKYKPVVLRRCRGILRNEEETKDAVQDVFVKLFKLEQEGYHISSYPCLLYTIATRVCFDRLRAVKVSGKKKEQIMNKKELDDFLSREVSFSPLYDIENKYNEYERVDTKLYAQTFLLSLLDDEEDKSDVSFVLVICFMYYFDGMGLEEICETIGMPPYKVEKLFATRHIYFMHALDGMTLEEIAEAKGMSHSGVHKKLENFRKLAQWKRDVEGRTK